MTSFVGGYAAPDCYTALQSRRKICLFWQYIFAQLYFALAYLRFGVRKLGKLYLAQIRTPY